MDDRPATERFYLDDLKIGQRFTSGTLALDAEQIKTFAREFDPQPFHLDEVAAENSIFQGLAASGWHTAALTMRLLVGGGLPLAAATLNIAQNNMPRRNERAESEGTKPRGEATWSASGSSNIRPAYPPISM